MKTNIWKFLTVTFGIALVIILLVLAILSQAERLRTEEQNKSDLKVKQAINNTRDDIFLFIWNEVARCDIMPLTINNQTLNLIAYECLRK